MKHILLINPNSDTFSNPVLFKVIEELNLKWYNQEEEYSKAIKDLKTKSV